MSSRTVDVPTAEEVRSTLEEILAEAQTVGRRPSVLALARRFGLTNTTFRRHFPEINQRAWTGTPDPTAGTRHVPSHSALRHTATEDAELRRDNALFSQHLELAIANIHRLTLENHQLRMALESASTVTRIGTKTRAT
jgi:hypothetical protein